MSPNLSTPCSPNAAEIAKITVAVQTSPISTQFVMSTTPRTTPPSPLIEKLSKHTSLDSLEPQYSCDNYLSHLQELPDNCSHNLQRSFSWPSICNFPGLLSIASWPNR